MTDIAMNYCLRMHRKLVQLWLTDWWLVVVLEDPTIISMCTDYKVFMSGVVFLHFLRFEVFDTAH